MFAGTAEVLEIEIPVQVTDRDGRPVRGLGAESFEIYDEGRRQEITGVRAVDLELLPADEGLHRLERELPPAARRRLLLLFDVSFSDPMSITRARAAAQRFVLDSLHPTDLVAVAVHSLERGARLLVTFTSDRARVARAIDALGSPEYLNPGLARDPLRFINDAAAGPEPGTGGAPGSASGTPVDEAALASERVARAERAFARHQISAWSRSLGETAEHLDSVRGRKHVVLFSAGFDGRLLFGHQPSADDVALTRNRRLVESGQLGGVDLSQIYGDPKLQRDLGEMIGRLRRADCVIQAVDVAGLTAGDARAERDRDVDQDALFFIANETGGSLLTDVNDLRNQLDRVLRQSEVTYLLSFQPSDARLEGRYHRLKIKGPKGTRLSYREGYFEPREFAGLHPLEKSLLASDAITGAKPRDDVVFDVIAVPFRGAPEVAYVPVILEIDGPSLMAGTEGDTLPLEIYAYPTDDQGRMPTYFSRALDIDLRRGGDALRRGGVKYYGHVILETGDYLLRVLVRNGETGATGVRTIEVAVPRFDAEGFLLPPFFMETPGQWLMVREAHDLTGGGGTTVYPFTVGGEPFIPAARPALARRQEARLCLVAYGMGHGDLALEAEVTASDGSAVTGGRLALVERTVTGVEGLDKLLASFSPRDLKPGAYTLRVALADPASGTVRTSSAPFVVH